MDKTHFELLTKIHVIHILTQGALVFFNQGLEKSQKANGVRLCFTDRVTGEDILNFCVGTFPLNRSEEYFQSSRAKAKQVSGPQGTLSSYGYKGDVRRGGLQGALYGVGVSGFNLNDQDEAVSAAIIFVVEKGISVLDNTNYQYMDVFRKEHYKKLESLIKKPGRNDNLINMMDYLLKDQSPLSRCGYAGFKEKVFV